MHDDQNTFFFVLVGISCFFFLALVTILTYSPQKHKQMKSRNAVLGCNAGPLKKEKNRLSGLVQYNFPTD